MSQLISSMLLGPGDIEVTVDHYHTRVGAQHWLQITRLGEPAAFNLLATEQQLTAMYEALKQWKEETLRNVRCDTCPPHANGSPSRT